MNTQSNVLFRDARQGRVVIFLAIALFIGWAALRLPAGTQAAPLLTISPTTWNMIGLDVDNLATSPNQYLVGARVCNQDTAPASDVRAVFTWDVNNPSTYISLSPGQPFTQTLNTLPAGECQDFYYQVEVTRSAAAIGEDRGFTIGATATGATPVNIPQNSALQVVALVPETTQPQTLSGPQNVTVGQQVQYVARQPEVGGKRHLVQQVLFSYPAFRVVDIQASYTLPPGATDDQFYADACEWDDDDVNCVVGGTAVTTYTVEILASGTYTLTHLVYDYDEVDGGRYNYQSGFDSDNLTITASQANQNETATAQAATATASALTATAQYTQTATAQAIGTATAQAATQTAQTTPTATGTITPSPVMTYTVNPREARVNQNLTFTIRVRNNGSAPAENASVTDSFSTVLDLRSVTSTKGTPTVNTSGRTFTVAFGTLMPGEEATITIITQVNANAKTTQTLTNSAVMTYSYGGLNRSVSATTSYRVIGSSTLPNTGGIQISHEKEGGGGLLVATGLILALVLGGLGAAGLFYGYKLRHDRPEWSGWYIKMGALFVVACLLFGAATWSIQNASRPAAISQVEYSPTQDQSLVSTITVQPIDQEKQIEIIWATPEPLTLPDYPVPTPDLPELESTEEPPDISAVTRIVIPALGVDTVVKYVPYDGLTWMIGGLQNEVAWMGETSWPGLGSNTAFAGHVTLRNGAAGPFAELHLLQDTDEIYLYTEQKIYTYRVRDIRTIEETDISVIQPSDSAQITLITCSEWSELTRFYMKRLALSAELVQSRALNTTGMLP